jgi:putative DNA primase/helicase
VIVGRRYCQVQGQVFTFESPAEFKKKFLHEKKISGKNRGQAWLEWPGKNIKLGGTGFFPDTKKCPPDALNFFRGLQVKPMAGDVKPYLDHLKHVICAGHEPSFHYLIGWMAHLFQKPDIKPSVAVVLKSVEGTGKGTMAEPLLRILGAHGNKTNGAYAIAGRFNGTVANRLMIFADEVDLTDKHVADRLKGIVSETTVNMERKGLEIEPLPNLLPADLRQQPHQGIECRCTRAALLGTGAIRQIRPGSDLFQKALGLDRERWPGKIIELLADCRHSRL